MKRLVAVLLVCVLTIGCLAGCGEKVDPVDAIKQTDASNQTGATETGALIEAGPITTDPITISILTTRTSNATSSVDSLWFFKYLEWWLNDQGYNVTIEVQQTMEPEQQISLLLGTDNLPDLVWGIGLEAEQAVTFGMDDGIILDWAPYLNEETMPNMMALLEQNPDALAASTCLDGGVYGLPYLVDRGWGQAAGDTPSYLTTYINETWLDQVNMDVPTNIDEFLNVLRAFKNEIKLENGQEVIPALNRNDYLERYLWSCLGYYGATHSKYGTKFAIKNEEVYLPAMTEDYRTFIEIMHTMYDEGLIAEDYFTMDKTTMRGLVNAGVCGLFGDDSLGNCQDWSEWTSVLPMTIGEDTEQYILSSSSNYKVSKIWASADTKYPEVLALLLDYVYSPEGSVLYHYGPQKGEDPLGILSGWYYDENGVITSDDMIAAGGTDLYTWNCDYVYPTVYTVNSVDYTWYAKVMAGQEVDINYRSYTDVVTGQEVQLTVKVDYQDDNADGHARIEKSNANEGHLTSVMLPTVYMSEDDAFRAAELASVIDDYIIAESAKFIVGERPLEEIDDFFEEMKQLDVEEYIQLYRDAYSIYMESIFEK